MLDTSMYSMNGSNGIGRGDAAIDATTTFNSDANDNFDALLADYNSSKSNGGSDHEPYTFGDTSDQDMYSYLTGGEEQFSNGGGAMANALDYDSSFGSNVSTTSSLSNVGSPQYLPSSTTPSSSTSLYASTSSIGNAPAMTGSQPNFVGDRHSTSATGSNLFGLNQFTSNAQQQQSPTQQQMFDIASFQLAQQQQQQMQKQQQQHQHQQQQMLAAQMRMSPNMNLNSAYPVVPAGQVYLAPGPAQNLQQPGFAAMFTPSPTNSTSSTSMNGVGSSYPPSGNSTSNSSYAAPSPEDLALIQHQQQAQSNGNIAYHHPYATAMAQHSLAQNLASAHSMQNAISVAPQQPAAASDSKGGEAKRSTTKAMGSEKKARRLSTVEQKPKGSKARRNSTVGPAVPQISPVAGEVRRTSAFNFALKSDLVNTAGPIVDLIANAGSSSVVKAKEKDKDKVESPSGDESKSGDAVGADGKKKKGPKNDQGHNAVERRYRNNINNHLSSLRDQIPALRHLKPLPSMPASRRRASQFTIATAAQLPTPAGLVDGIPAAKTLSKGTILGKAIEYIHFLQQARSDGQEDIDLFKQVVFEMVGGGQQLIEVFEQRRAIKEEARKVLREQERKEQEALEEEDEAGSGDDEADEAEEKKAAPAKAKATKKTKREAPTDQPTGSRSALSSTVLDNLAQLRQQSNMLISTSPNALPPSPVSSSDDTGSNLMQQHQNFGPSSFRPSSSHHGGPPRVLLASFLGMSFAGGLGYDWTYSSAPVAADSETARAWAGRLVGRSNESVISGSNPIISSDVLHPSLLTGLVFMGGASIIAIIVFVLYPLFSRDEVSASDASAEPETTKSRSIYRQRRRAQALSALAELTDATTGSGPQSYETELKSALAARKQLLKLVGAPTYGLLPALAKESLATLLRKVTTIRVGSFARWSEEQRVEAAVAWVRIAEIEATVAAEDVNYLARWYTFLRLFNLSHSASWPETNPSTCRPAVNAVLAMNLLSLGQPLSAYALWTKATRQAEKVKKKTDARMHSFVEIALATEWQQVRRIVSSTNTDAARPASPSDTSPLIRIAEARCRDALLEAWAKIFQGVVATTCPPPPAFSRAKIDQFSDLVDQPFLEETVAHVLESTVEGSSIRSMAIITKALCAHYGGDADEATVLRTLLRSEYERDGPAKRLRSVKLFFELVPAEDASPFVVSPALPSDDETIHVNDEVDHLASVTLSWLLLRRRIVVSISEEAKPSKSPKADPILHADALSLRRQLGLASTQILKNQALRGMDDNSTGLTLDSAVDACLDALTDVTRRAAGLKSFGDEKLTADGESDSGVEVD